MFQHVCQVNDNTVHCLREIVAYLSSSIDTFSEATDILDKCPYMHF